MTDATKNHLDTLIAQAPKTLIPPAPLWDKIESRLDTALTDTPRESHSLRALAIACSVLLIAFLSYQVSKPESIPLAQVQPTSPLQIEDTKTGKTDDLLALILQVETEHQRTITALEDNTYTINWRESAYSHPIENGLNELRQAAQQILQHLKTAPSDKQLWQLWLWVQQREIDLLQQGQKLPQPNREQLI